MKKWKDENGNLNITCDNLGEYFNEFAQYRNLPEIEKWIKAKEVPHEGFLEDLENNKMVTFLVGAKNDARKLELPVDLKSSEWESYREKIRQTLKEIWKTGENKNLYNLDLNWPTSSQQSGSKKEQEKAEIKKALTAPFIKNNSAEEAKQKLEEHIGFQREKDKFENYVYLYAATKDGKFRPEKEIICYAGAPGTGKTTFVKALKEAMGVPMELISCSNLKESSEFSILGDENKPSLPAWVMKKNGCKNFIILLDEGEKVHDEQIQRDLKKLFGLYLNKEGQDRGETESKKLFDKYYQMDIELDHILFFMTVNYPDDLVPQLKSVMEMRRLEDYSKEEKEKILRLKKAEIEKKWETVYGEKKELIPEQIIKLLPQYIKEGGIRQTERVLYKIEREWINAKENGKEFSLGDPQQWLKKNVLAYQENFSPKLKHFFLFSLWAIIWIFLLAVIINKVILRKEKLNE